MKKTDDCRAARAPSGFFRNNAVLPQVPGGEKAQECKWERKVLDCPRVRDKVVRAAHCLGDRKDKSGYSLFAPRE